MEINNLFYKVFKFNIKDNKPISFIGSSFSISPDKHLLTCRHVVEQELLDDEKIAVFDGKTNKYILVENCQYSKDSDLDLALLTAPVTKDGSYFPILPTKEVMMGSDVSTYGNYSIGKGVEDVTQGYFSGKVSNISLDRQFNKFNVLTLPFPIIEGLSGSPLFTYHNGNKLVVFVMVTTNNEFLLLRLLNSKMRKKSFQKP